MVVVFSGYNQRAVLAFLRTLRKNSLEYVIIASGIDDSIFLTDYSKNVIYTRKNKNVDAEEILFALQNIIRTNKQIFMAPVTEYLNRWMLDNRKMLEKKGCIIPLVNKKVYETISDKKPFYDLCKKCDIAVPKNVNPEDYNYNVVAKPKNYVSGDGNIYSPTFLSGESEYREFCAIHKVDDFNFQEFLTGGESIYLLFYFSRKGAVYVYSQKNLAQQQGGKSILAAISAEYHKEEKLISKYRNMFRKIAFSGLVMVEIRRYKGTDYMIEANPRFWGPSQLFCDAGYNLFEAMLYDYGILCKKPTLRDDKRTMYLWSDGTDSNLIDIKTIKWHENGKEFYTENIDKFKTSDIYNRKDSEKIYKTERIERLKSIY